MNFTAKVNKGNNDVGFTPTQLTLLKLDCEGLSTKEAAEKMKISAKTVDALHQQMYEKIKLKWTKFNRRSALMLYAITQGIVEVNKNLVIAFLAVGALFFADSFMSRNHASSNSTATATVIIADGGTCPAPDDDKTTANY